ECQVGEFTGLRYRKSHIDFVALVGSALLLGGIKRWLERDVELEPVFLRIVNTPGYTHGHNLRFLSHSGVLRPDLQRTLHSLASPVLSAARKAKPCSAIVRAPRVNGRPGGPSFTGNSWKSTSRKCFNSSAEPDIHNGGLPRAYALGCVRVFDP